MKLSVVTLALVALVAALSVASANLPDAGLESGPRRALNKFIGVRVVSLSSLTKSSAPAAKPEAKPEAAAAPKPEPKPEPAPEPKPEPAPAPKPEPAPEPKAAPAPSGKGKSVSFRFSFSKGH